MTVILDGNAQNGWNAATRTLTDFSAEELFDLPIMDTGYSYASPASSASANTFGSWVQLSANIGTGKRLIYVVIGVNHDSAAGWEIEIGEGASASEAAVARVSGTALVASGVGHRNSFVFPVWKSLTASARISCRAKDENASATAYSVNILVV